MKVNLVVYLHNSDVYFMVATLSMSSQEHSHSPAQPLAQEMRALLGQIKRRLREQSQPGGLSAGQIAVLSRLHHDGPSTVTRLARAEGVRPQSMGATVAALKAAGWVCGAADPADKRQSILSLSAACRATMAANRAARQDWLSHAIDHNYTPEEQQTLAAAIELLKRLVTCP